MPRYGHHYTQGLANIKPTYVNIMGQFVLSYFLVDINHWALWSLEYFVLCLINSSFDNDLEIIKFCANITKHNWADRDFRARL